MNDIVQRVIIPPLIHVDIVILARRARPIQIAYVPRGDILDELFASLFEIAQSHLILRTEILHLSEFDLMCRDEFVCLVDLGSEVVAKLSRVQECVVEFGKVAHKGVTFSIEKSRRRRKRTARRGAREGGRMLTAIVGIRGHARTGTAGRWGRMMRMARVTVRRHHVTGRRVERRNMYR